MVLNKLAIFVHMLVFIGRGTTCSCFLNITTDDRFFSYMNIIPSTTEDYQMWLLPILVGFPQKQIRISAWHMGPVLSNAALHSASTFGGHVGTTFNRKQSHLVDAWTSWQMTLLFETAWELHRVPRRTNKLYASIYVNKYVSVNACISKCACMFLYV